MTSYAEKQRKGFTPLGGTNDEGKEYEAAMLAYYSLQLAVNDQIKDFNISTNNKDYKGFDDIVVAIVENNDNRETYAFQLKHVENNKKRLTDEQALTSYKKYFEPDRFFQDCTCILLTNASFYTERNPRAKIVNDDERRFYKIFDNSQSVEFQNIRKIKHPDIGNEIHFFTGQPNLKKAKLAIIRLFKDLFHVSPNIPTQFLEFFKQYKEGTFGHFNLDKEDVKLKIFELVFWDYIHDFTTDQEVFIKNENNFELLRKACNSFHVTVIKPIKENNHLTHLINPDFDGYQRDPKIKKIRKSCLLVPESSAEISKKQLSYIMWHKQDRPLILNVQGVNQETLYKTINFVIKHQMEPRRLLLFGNTVDVNRFENLNVFENLSDLENNNPTISRDIIGQFKLSLQGRTEITVKQLQDYLEESRITVASVITAGQLLEMAGGSCLVGQEENLDFPEHYVKRNITRKIITADKIFRINIYGSILIDCKDKITEIEDMITDSGKTFVNIVDYLESGNKKGSIILMDENTPKDKANEALKKEQNAIHLKASTGSKFEILACNTESMNILQEYATDDWVHEDKTYDVFKGRVTVVCAEPGMGKSTFTKSLAKNCPSHFWIQRIECKEYNDFFQEKRQLVDVLNKFFAQDEIGMMFKNHMKFLILDGLDEMEFSNVDNVMKCVKSMADAGVTVWVTARHNLQDKLEKYFKLFSLDIEEFTEEIQRKYIRDRLTKTYTDEEISVVLCEVFNNTRLIQNKEILGVPLQLYMLTELLINDRNKFQEMSEKSFVLTKMYECFFEGKFKHYLTKMNLTKQHLTTSQQALHNEFEETALISTLSSDIIQHLPINVKNILRKYEAGNPYHIGIIKKVEKGIPIFTHQTYAEYFAACWLAENLMDNLRKIPEGKRRFLFEDKHQNLRILFDMKLSENLPLHLAVLYKNVDDVRNNIVQVNTKDRLGRNALHIACCYGTKHMLLNDFQLFVEQRRPGKTVDDYGIRQLEMIPKINTNEKFQTLIKCLVEASNDETLKEDDLFQFTPILYADNLLCLALLEVIAKRHPEAIKFDKLHIYKDITTVFYYSAYYNYSHLFKLTFDYVDGGKDTVIGRNFLPYTKSLLHVAALRGSLKICEFLLNHKADVNASDATGYSPLMYASSRKQNIEVCTLLIKGGARIEQVNKSGATALLLASRRGNVEICQLLLDNNANINHMNIVGDNALMYAIRNERQELTQFLIAKGVSVNLKSKLGKTPLILATQTENLELCQLLVENKADVNQVDNYHITPLIIAIWSRNLNIIQLLIKNNVNINQAGKKGKTPLWEAAGTGDIQICGLLILNGADVNKTTDDGMSLLTYAINCGDVKLYQLLIDNGADVNHVDKYGKGVLVYASETDYFTLETCQMVIENGADVNGMVKNESLLMYFVRRENVELCRLLVDKGADINQVDKDGKTPLMYAAEIRNVELCDLLVQRSDGRGEGSCGCTFSESWAKSPTKR